MESCAEYIKGQISNVFAASHTVEPLCCKVVVTPHKG